MAAAPSRNIPFPLVAVVSWGAMFPVLASALVHVDALNLTAVRYGLATLAFVAFLIAREGPAALRLDGRAGPVSVLGILGFAGFNLLTNLALGHAAPQNVALFAATTPVVTHLVRWVRDGVRPRPVLLGLSVFALVGVGLVITRGRLDGLSRIGVGELMMIAAVLCWAMYTHGSSRFGDWSPLRYTTLTAVAGTLALLLAAAVADLAGWQHAPNAAALTAIAPQLAYVVVLGAVIAVLAWNTGAQRLGPANAALFMNLVPVTTFVVQIARGYRPVAVELVGAALTLAALVAANLATRSRMAASPVTTSVPCAGAGARRPAEAVTGAAPVAG